MGKLDSGKQVAISPDGFINMLNALNGGSVVDELDRALIAGMQAIHDNGGKSEIALKIKFSYTQGLEKTVTIENDVKTTFPKEKRPKSLMFETQGCGLVTQVQEQQGLDLKPAKEQAGTKLEEAPSPKVTQLKPAC